MAIEITNATSPQPVKTQVTPTADPEPASTQLNAELANAAPDPSEAKPAKEPALDIAVSNINDFVQNIQRSIHFSIAEDSGRTIIKVYDAVTDELIREIPSEELQRISKAIEEQLSSGLLLKVNI